ncbi:hypothetical protein [Nitrosomonas eutropha]|uniref:Uncharacterized protein n=1 Tax=Nitrosomonas eutropha TaxID=916 RepID=A0ABX5MAL3_9PROT|nr:hypothetical protein [Nitrosomonas eutropha]PXV82202.1 hypothetical protein C8R14_10924 [Nitrosomonas eutropha]SEI81408.1 hypothetical protein SAMN05216318_11217 [Nitrosomonas eutropha]
MYLEALGSILIDEIGLHAALTMRHDMPNDWHMLKKNGFVDLTIAKFRIPKNQIPMRVAAKSRTRHVVPLGWAS